MSAAAIAERLNAEGFRPPKRADRFNRGMVQRLLCRLELARRKPHGSPSGLGQDEYRPGGLARRLEIARDTVRRWLRAGWLTSSRDAEGHHVIWADASELARLRELHALPRTWANKDRLAELTKPNPARSGRLRWPGSRRAGPPHLALGGHYGWKIEEMFKQVKYQEIPVRSYKSKPELKAAVEQGFATYGYSLLHEATASGRVTRRASSDPACFLRVFLLARPSESESGVASAERSGGASIRLTSTPPTGATSRRRPPRGAFLIPRPLAEEPHPTASNKQLRPAA